MTHEKKALGLALIAAFAMSAVAAAGASAAEFTSENYPTTISGSTEEAHVFGAGEGLEFSCNENSFTTTEVTESTGELMVDATYGNCEFAGLPSTLDRTNCSYTFTITGFDLSCLTGSTGTHVRIYLDEAHQEEICSITFRPTLDTSSTGVTDWSAGVFGRTFPIFSGIEYVNNENGTVTANFNIEEQMPYEYNGVLCPDETGVLFKNGSYNGSVTLSGTNGAIDVN